MPIETSEFVIAAAVTFLAAAVQGVVGMGFAVVSVPILRTLSPLLAPVPQLLMSPPMTASMAWRERHHLDLGGVGWILAGRFPGALLGLGLIAVASEKALDVIIGVAVLGAVAIIGGGFSVRRTPATKFGAGTLSGVLSIVASIGGPPVALLYRDEPGPTVRSSLAVVFFVGIIMTIVIRLVAGKVLLDEAKLALYLWPAQLLGLRVSTWAKDVVPAWVVRTGILILSAAAAAILLVGALA
jgi:uncharacterized membrane protein YfcA